MYITKKRLTVDFATMEEFAFFIKKMDNPNFEMDTQVKAEGGFIVDFSYKNDGFVKDVNNIIALKDFTIQDGIEFVVREKYESSFDAMCLLDDLGFEREKIQSELEDEYIFEGDRDDELERLGLKKMIDVIEDVFKEKGITYTSLLDMIKSKGTISEYEACCEVAQDIYERDRDGSNLFARYTPDIVEKLKTGEKYSNEEVDVDERG